MAGAAAEISRKEEVEAAKAGRLKERLQRLLREAAEVEVELSRADGSIRGVPHYSVIEGRAHELGRELSRQVQQRQMGELAASQPRFAKCPSCGTRCEVQPRQREVQSVDGAAELPELAGSCPYCRKLFFSAP